MKVLHIVPEINEANGVCQVARMLAREDGDEVAALADVTSANIVGYSEVWVHGMWLPREWYACWKVLRNVRMFECSNVRPKLVRMTHGSLSPIYLKRQGKWKKWLVAPIERWLFKRTDRVVVTCEAEKKWCQTWGLRNRFEIVDLKRFFDLGGGEGLGRRSRSTAEDPLHVLYLGRRHPLKGVEFLERAVRENQSESGVEVEQRRVEFFAGVEKDRRVWALRKIDEWLQGVDAESFDAALNRLVGERSASNVYRFRKSGDRERAMAAARRFFCEFSRKIVELSDGRCVYFAPDARSKARNGGDLSRCWAEYAFHAVSSGGALLVDKGYHERWYNLSKVINFEIIEKALLAEKCVPVLKNRPQEDSIKFFAMSLQGGNFDVVVRLDEYGNAQANMTEVTFEVNQRKLKKLPRLVPLAEAVQTVVYHQTTAGSYPSDNDNITHMDAGRKGAVREIRRKEKGEGRKCGVELRIVCDHFGEELERDWAWCDVLVLPTLSENFGLVVAEALERGKRVVTTDGAPAWGEGELFDCSDCSDCSIGYGGRLVYLKGYRDGTDEERVRLLKEAIGTLV